MDEKENQDLALEDILKEFGDVPAEEEKKEDLPEAVSEEVLEEIDEDVKIPDWLEKAASSSEEVPEEPNVDLQATRRMEAVRITEPEEASQGDTVRLDGLRESIAELTGKQYPDAVHIEEEKENLEDTIRAEPFSENWEPEYEQPIGEYKPPQPIQFNPRSRLRELKRKLVAGPEKRFYDLAEKGVGKLQAAIFLSVLVVLIAAASTVMYAFGMVQENRLRLMVFGQFLAFLVSSLLGSFQIIEGFADIFKKRFTLNTLLGVTFLVCCLDGVLCLQQLRVSCCAAFSLAVTMSLWGAYQRRSIEMAQMDTLRKATRLNGVVECPDYLDGKKGLLRMEGQVEDFMDHYGATGKPEKRLNIFGLIGMILALGIGVAAGVLKSGTEDVMTSISTGVQVAAVSLLAAVPASGFICQSRPEWILERRLHKLGTVLCGWRGVEGLCGKAVFPVNFGDLFPAEAVRMNGIKFFGNRDPDQVIAYATALVVAEGSGLTNLFDQILDSHNGRHYDAAELCHYDNGGLGGTVGGEAVLMGSAAFMKENGIEITENTKLNYGVYVAINGELSALFAVNYDRIKSSVAGISTLNSYRRLCCALISDDFMLNHPFLRSKFSIKVKRFLLPEREVRAQLRQRLPEEGTPALLMATANGLAPVAYAVTGARVLRTTCRMGMVLHILGGLLGLGIMVLLVVLGALDLLTPVNMFLYQLVWLIPALLVTEWTRSI